MDLFQSFELAETRYDRGRSRPPTISPTDLDFQRPFYSVEPIRLSEGEEEKEVEEEGKEGQGYTCTCNDCAGTAQPHRPCLLIVLQALNILRFYFIQSEFLVFLCVSDVGAFLYTRPILGSRP